MALRTLFDQDYTFPHTFTGTNMSERMIGNGLAERIIALGGNDELHANHSFLSDPLSMFGGFGNDTFFFGGNVSAHGGRGSDEFVVNDDAPSTAPAVIRDFTPNQGDTLVLDFGGFLAISADANMRGTVIDADTVQLNSALIVGFSENDLVTPGDNGTYVQVNFKNYRIQYSGDQWQDDAEVALYSRANLDGGLPDANDFIL